MVLTIDEFSSVSGCNHKVQVHEDRVWVCGDWFPREALQKIALAVLRAEVHLDQAPLVRRQRKELEALREEKLVKAGEEKIPVDWSDIAACTAIAKGPEAFLEFIQSLPVRTSAHVGDGEVFTKKCISPGPPSPDVEAWVFARHSSVAESYPDSAMRNETFAAYVVSTGRKLKIVPPPPQNAAPVPPDAAVEALADKVSAASDAAAASASDVLHIDSGVLFIKRGRRSTP